MIELSNLVPNPDNPRQIDQYKFDLLKESIKRDSKFMKLRPIIIDGSNVIIAGNMRFRALQALEYKSIPNEWIRVAKELTEEERRRFIIIDNVEFGHFDFDILTSHYEEEELIEWGVDIPTDPIDEEEEVKEISYSFKIRCDNLDELIDLRDLLGVDSESKSMSFGNFKMLFEHRK